MKSSDQNPMKMNIFNSNVLGLVFIYLNLIKFLQPYVIPTNDVEIFTTDWNPTPPVCVQGRVMGLIQVYEVIYFHSSLKNWALILAQDTYN